MSKKLGQILIDRTAITDDQLETALRNQLMLGGHLGTCLLELGLVDEKKLGDALVAAIRVPYADPEFFRRIHPIAAPRRRKTSIGRAPRCALSEVSQISACSCGKSWSSRAMT